MSRAVALAVMGAGLIGRRHIAHVVACPRARLVAVVDPAPAGEEVARAHGVAWFPTLAAMLEMVAPDEAPYEVPEGIIVATPNAAHLDNALACIAAGIPALVEKPLCDSVAGAERLVAAAEAAGVAVLVGHHRRHNPLMAKARAMIEGGAIGTPIVANAMFWIRKPDDYFDLPWRREAGAGPVLVNLVHDVDNLRFLLGEVVAVTARDSNAVRGHGVEETAVVLLEFASGALATASVCDATVAPWSWEMTSGENPAYPREAGEHCYLIGGTMGSLALPQLDLRTNAGKQGWWEPFDLVRPGVAAGVADADPLARQVAQFCAVIRGEEAPLVPAREGLATLRVIEAVKRSAATGARIVIETECRGRGATHE